MTTWTDDRIAQLSRLWIEGASASAIARALGEGVSRSAVLGKLQRLGLLKTRKAAAPPRLIADLALAEGQVAAAFPLRRARRREPPPSPWKAEAFRPLAGTTPRVWLTRGEGECAFPVGGEGTGSLSCCAPCARGRTYCQGHHAVVFRAAPAIEAVANFCARRAA